MPRVRDYERERANYDSRPEVMAKNASRKRARRAAIKAGMISEKDPRDIHHVAGRSNRLSNLKPVAASVNRSFPRTRSARKINPQD